MRNKVEILKTLQAKWKIMSPLLDERSKRIWAGMEADRIGWGGITLVEKATGLTNKTISKGRLNIKTKRRNSKEIYRMIYYKTTFSLETVE